MSRTLLLGLDGATFTLLDPLMAQGRMPFLKSFMERGVRATLMSTPCPVTPPAWTSMTTGVGPGQHGIFDFISGDDSSGKVHFHMETARGVRAESLWSILNRHGRRAAALNFPVSYLTPTFDGYMVPGFVTARVLKMGVFPREFWDRIKTLPGFDAKAISWNSEGGEVTLGSTRMHDMAELTAWVDKLKAKETGWYVIARELIDRNDTDLIAMVFEGVDRLQHLNWDLLDPAYFPKNPTAEDIAARDYCYSYYTHVDNYLKQLVEAAGPETRVFICSDHGFGSTTELFYVNEWLARHGYLKWKESAHRDGQGLMSALNMRDHYDSIDFEHTVAYARTASANGIYIRVKTDANFVGGIAPERYHALRNELEQKLLAWKDPATGTPVVTHAVTRDEAFPGRAHHLAPDLTLTLRDGGFVSILPSDELVKQRPEVKGTHRPAGVFFAGGPGLRAGARLATQSIVNVAPTLLYSLGLDVPSDLQGVVVQEAFELGHLQAHPVKIGAPTQPPVFEEAKSSERLSEADQNVVLERLKALGYIE